MTSPASLAGITRTARRHTGPHAAPLANFMVTVLVTVLVTIGPALLPTLLASLLAGAAGLSCASATTAPSATLPATLATADALSRTRPADAVALLNRYASAPEAAPLAVRRAVLLRLRRTHLDLGDYAAANADSVLLRALGRQHNDALSTGWADMTGIEEQIRAFQSDAAKAALESLGRTVRLQEAPDLGFAVHMAYGRLYLLKAEFERAIEQFQAGVEMAPQTEAASSSRVEALRYLAYAYLALDDKQRALTMINTALESDDGTLAAHVRALLHLGHAIILAELARYTEAETAFALALGISRDGGLREVESRVLGDWANLALRREQYVSAERLSRQALQVAEAISDKGATIARANIGFALAGQGKVAEGLPYIDAVIGQFRQQGNGQALLAALDEKGRMLQRQGWLKDALAVVREQQQLERQQFTEQRGKAVAALQERFASEQDRQRIELLQKQNKLKDADIRNRELRLVALGLGILLAIAVGILLGLLYRRARKSNAQLQAQNSRLAEHAERDQLTGLYNRRSFVEMMQARAARSGERRSGAPEAGETFMLLDLDHFKAVNDTHGHTAGDAVLVEVARRLQAAVRDSDTVLRWGGEEFVIYSPGGGDSRGATLAQRVLCAVGKAPITAGETSLPVTVSIGMVALPFAGLADAACGWQGALQLADAALYVAKHDGRNRCCQLLPGAAPLRASLTELEHDLRGAAAAGQVVLCTILPSAADDRRERLLPAR